MVAALIPLLAALTIFCMLFLISDTIHRLGHTWISRFERLRNLSMAESDEVSTDFKDSKQNAEQFKVMKDHLGRDASERYLFLCKWTMEVGRFWKAFITQILIVPTFGLAYFLYMVIETVDGENREPAFLYFGLFFITVWCIACPLYAVSYSNSAIEKIRECVIYSSPEDFSAVGGRSSWLEFFDAAPCYWHVYGWAITPRTLMSFITTSTLSALGVALSVFHPELGLEIPEGNGDN